MSKQEFLQEKMQLMDKEKKVEPPQADTNNVLALQAEIEQAEILLKGLIRKSKVLDTAITESETKKAQAEEELRLVKDTVKLTSTKTRSSAPTSGSSSSSSSSEAAVSSVERPVSKADAPQNSSAVNTITEMERFQTQKTK
jgi:hypothetical protein